MLQASATFLKNAASTLPLLLILEDLHDADHGTLDLLIHLSRRLGDTRVLVVGTYRDTDVDRTHPLICDARGASQELELRANTDARPCRRGGAPDLSNDDWGSDVAPGAEAVHQQTEGNPLFVVELLRYVEETAAPERVRTHTT